MMHRPHQTWQPTDLQQSMLRASMEPNTLDVYILQRVIALQATIQDKEIREAWLNVVKHHSILRMQFTFHSGAPRLSHLKNMDDSLAFRFSKAKDEAHAETIYKKEYETPFTFDTSAPLWRLHTVKVGDQLTLCLSCHHTIADQRTLSILLQDIDCALSGKPLPPARGFEEYLDWFTRQDFSHLERKWRDYAAPLHEATLLPEESGLGFKNDPSTARFSIPMDENLSADLRAFAKAHDITLNTILLGAWAFILSRLTFQPAVCFGAVRAGCKNSLPDAASIAGPLIKTLPFIQPVPEDSNPADFLRTVRQRWQFLYEADHCPQENLKRWTAQTSYSHLFSTVFNFVIQEKSRSRHGESEPRTRLILTRQNKVQEPTLGIYDTGSSLEIGLFTPARYASFCNIASEALPHVLRQFISTRSPLKTISLCPQQTEQLLAFSSGGTCSYEDQTLTALVEKSLVKHAEALALDGRIQKTFADLDRESRSLASRLHLEQTDKKRPCAIVFPPGLYCIASMLAVIRAGGHFICLDPACPQEDTRTILSAANPHSVLTTPDRMEELKDPRWNVFPVSECDLITGKTPNLPVSVQPAELSYLVHTSGTTGTPRVIQIEHHSIANLIAGILPVYALKTGDRRLQRARPGSDFFIAEVLITLCGGATLVFPEATEIFTPAEFFAQIEAHRITVTGIPSSYWRELVRSLVDRGAIRLAPSLRLMIVGMEPVDPEMLRVWNELAPERVRLLNVYGPSETTVISTTYCLQNGIPDGETRVPIGKPLPNTSAYILDCAGQLLPQGAIGEICIAGAGLMRGYAGQNTTPDFPPNPHDQRPGFSRIYRTGDFGYINSAGDLVFTGRRDGQVKIRGHRVELGAVEMHLSKAAGGAQAIALVIRRGQQNSLLGLIESKNNPDGEALRAVLRQNIKEAYIPSTILFFDIFPRLPNGKIDRQLLRNQAEKHLAAQQTSPRAEKQTNGTTAAKIISIWNRLFEIQDCSDESNFFELGGDSLSAVTLFTILEKELRVTLPISTLVNHPTISALAALIDSNPSSAKWNCLVPFKSTGTRPPLFLVHDISGQPLIFKKMVEYIHADQPVYTLQSKLLNGRFSKRTSIENIARSYLEEIRSIQPHGPYSLGGFSFGGVLALEMMRQLLADGEPINRLFIFDSKAPGNAPHRPGGPAKQNKNFPHSGPRLRLRKLKRSIRQFARQKPKRRRAKETFHGYLLHACLRLNLPLSSRQKERYIVWHHRQAVQHYFPKPCPGNITLIHTSKNAAKKITGWENCVSGKLTALPMEGLHADIFHAPRAEILANLVEKCLKTLHPPE